MHRYITFIKDNMAKFFPGALPETGWIALVLVPALTLSVPDRVGFLSPFSLFGQQRGSKMNASEDTCLDFVRLSTRPPHGAGGVRADKQTNSSWPPLMRY